MTDKVQDQLESIRMRLERIEAALDGMEQGLSFWSKDRAWERRQSLITPTPKSKESQKKG